jgi:hypothetical protein
MASITPSHGPNLGRLTGCSRGSAAGYYSMGAIFHFPPSRRRLTEGRFGRIKSAWTFDEPKGNEHNSGDSYFSSTGNMLHIIIRRVQ